MQTSSSIKLTYYPKNFITRITTLPRFTHYPDFFISMNSSFNSHRNVFGAYSLLNYHKNLASKFKNKYSVHVKFPYWQVCKSYVVKLKTCTQISVHKFTNLPCNTYYRISLNQNLFTKI